MIVFRRTDIQFQEGEVVHTFGDANAVIKINGLNVPYVVPSAIAEDKKIRVVFFKESLSIGWDCPRAETMMSFRHATDSIYIAQLLGRMIRTPKQMHIHVDETLNDVHLYLPYFNLLQAVENCFGMVYTIFHKTTSFTGNFFFAKIVYTQKGLLSYF